MTGPTDPTPVRAAPDEPLPGLGPDPTDHPVGGMEQQARRTLSKLTDLGYIGEEHAGQMQLYLTLARTIDRTAAGGRAAYAVAQCAKEMRELFESFIPDDAEGEAAADADFTRWQRELHGVDAPGSGT